MSSPKKILMTAEAGGEIWSYALELARGMSRKDVEVILAVSGRPLDADERAQARSVDGLLLEARPSKVEWMDRPWEDIDATGRWLMDLEARWAPDLVHLNGYAHGALPFEAPKVVVGHSCVFSWWWAVNGSPPTAEWLAYHRRAAAGLRSADLVVAPTRWMLQTLQRHYGPLLASVVIGNGCEPSEFAVGNKEPFVLGAGRLWDDAQNLKMLARVAGRLQWPVLLAGEPTPPRFDGTSGFPDAKGPPPGSPGRPFPWQGEARLLGRLPAAELADTYGRASIFALPARYEPFGLSVLEAAMAGCPLVLGDIPSLRELWDEAATFVPPEDDAALVNALQTLICDGAARRAMAAAARHRALRWTARRMVDGYAVAYGELIAHRAQPVLSATAASLLMAE